MSTDSKMGLAVLASVITGLAVSTGHLDAANADEFQQNVQTLLGGLLTLISIVYLLEHLLITKKKELSSANTTAATITETTATSVSPQS